MSKKSFNAGLNSLLGESPTRPEAAPQKIRRQTRKPGPAPKHVGPVVRATFILDPDQLAKFKAIAYWERKDISEQLRGVIAEFVKAYEKKNGPVEPTYPPKNR